MGRWARKLAWLMAPLGERLLAHILKAPKIHGDETPVTLLMGEDGSHTAYFWVYLRDGRSSGDISPPAGLPLYDRARRRASRRPSCRI
jgi:hypothetical protein